MPPFILLALAGTGLYAGYKFYTAWTELTAKEEAAKMQQRRKGSGTAKDPKDLGELEWDEKAGVYRPKSGA